MGSFADGRFIVMLVVKIGVVVVVVFQPESEWLECHIPSDQSLFLPLISIPPIAAGPTGLP